MDVWLDSGVSWHAALKCSGLPLPADMYLEGSDQHRGWFQSSLITSVALSGQAPYRTVLTHGFVLDENGRKMSKSLGNVIDPAVLVHGNEKKPGCGIDVMRMWVASSDYSHDILIGPVAIEKVKTSLRKLRNTARFLLGNLADFDRAKAVPYDHMTAIDRYMLHKLHELYHSVVAGYEKYQFSGVYRWLVNFATVDLSSFYFDAVKDRLYTYIPDSQPRRSAQTVLRHTLDFLNTAIAPIIPFTAQDIYRHDAQALAPTIFHNDWPLVEDQWKQSTLAQKWEVIRDVRAQVYRVLEAARSQKAIGSSLGAQVRLYTGPAGNQLAEWLSELSCDELAEVFIVSHVELIHDVAPFEVNLERKEAADLSSGGTSSFVGGGLVCSVPIGIEALPAANSFGKCLRCWRYCVPKGDTRAETCARCAEALHHYHHRHV